MGLEERIRHFIVENFYVAEETPFDDDTSLIGSGIVDSTGVLEVVAFLEQEVGIKVPDRDIVPANLDSVARIAAYAARARAQSHAPRATPLGVEAVRARQGA